jgi:hypothetical protein
MNVAELSWSLDLCRGYLLPKAQFVAELLITQQFKHPTAHIPYPCHTDSRTPSRRQYKHFADVQPPYSVLASGVHVS